MALDRYDVSAVARLDGREECQRARGFENDLRFKLAHECADPHLRLVPATEIPRRP